MEGGHSRVPKKLRSHVSELKRKPKFFLALWEIKPLQAGPLATV